MLKNTIIALTIAASTILPFATIANAGTFITKEVDCAKAKQKFICRATKYNPFAKKSMNGICVAFHGKKAKINRYKMGYGWNCKVDLM